MLPTASKRTIALQEQTEKEQLELYKTLDKLSGSFSSGPSAAMYKIWQELDVSGNVRSHAISVVACDLMVLI